MLTIKPQDVSALIEAFERSTSQEMRVAAGNFELQLSKNANGVRQVWGSRAEGRATAAAPVALAPSAPAQPASEAPSAAPKPETQAAKTQPGAVAATPPAGHTYVRAANLGTFYRSPKPGAPSYVEIGTRVTTETEVCLIEVMKLFTPLIAGTTGVVRDVLVSDGALVEFDQPLFLVQLEA